MATLGQPAVAVLFIVTLGNAFAGGVFLGAGIIGEEFAGHHNQWLKFALVALGLGLMAVVAIWT